MKKTGKKLTNNQIMAIIISSIILAVGLGIGIKFLVDEMKAFKTDYGTTNSIMVLDTKTVTFNHTCPYSKKGLEFDVDESKKVIIEDLTDGNNIVSYTAEVTDVVYKAEKNQEHRGGKITVTVKVDGEFEFLNDNTYRLYLPEGTIIGRTDNHKIEEISEAFVCKANGQNGFYVDRTEIKDYETEEIKETQYSIVKEDKKYYINAVVDAGNFTKLNEKMLEELKTGVTLAFRDEAGMYLIRTYADNITAEFGYGDGSKVLVKTLIPENELIVEGTEYTFYLEEGLLSNDSGDSVSAKYEGKYTFMG